MLIKFDDIKQEKNESNPLPERIDTGKAIITEPALIAKYKELEEKKADKITVAEKMQLHRLTKYGDKATGKNKLTAKTTNRPTQIITLEKANKNPITPTDEALQRVIESIYNGSDFITACQENDIRPKDFYKWIDKPENQQNKVNFINARCILAEYYLYRRESLEKDLLSGRIDSSTYSTLANDYKYLAGKLAPLAYGDKIQLDAQINKQTTLEVLNTEKVKELNSLLQSNIIDADFTEE